MHNFFCFSNSPLVLGENNSNLPRILTIIVEAFHKGAFEDAIDAENTKNRLIQIVKYLHVSYRSNSCHSFMKVSIVVRICQKRVLFSMRA